MCSMISGLFIGSNDGRPPQAYKEIIVSLSRFRLNAILFVLEYFSCEEKNERQIPLALYIRLEYSVRSNER